MKKYYLLTVLMATIGALNAQMPPIAHLDVNNVKATILGNGSCYYQNNWDINSGTPKTCLAWEIPEGSGKETIHQHSLWFGGLDSNGSLHLSALRYGQNGTDYWMGPLRLNDASTDLITSLKYHHVWDITRSEIEQFIALHGNPDYQVPQDILTWPAHGEAGFAANIAPFVDVNGDGQYSPADGDYPDIKGDQCLFFVFNDSYGDHTETDGATIGLEAHVMVYAFDAPDDEALNNTVFVNYKFFNRSSNDYNDVFVGLWYDWDIGCENDDYVGCDVDRNSCFAYNGTPVDGNDEPWAYGADSPVQVCTVLSSPNNLGMGGFVCHDNGDGGTGSPQNAMEYYNLLKGSWRDGNEIQYGGNGYPNQPNTVGPACHFMYPGDSDPDNTGTGFMMPNGGYNANGVYWTEEHEENAPGNRMGLASIGPFDFPSGSVKELDYAMLTVFGNESQTSTERKNTFIDHVRVFFDDYYNKKIKFIKRGTDLMIRSRMSVDNDILLTMYLKNGNVTFKNSFVGDKTLNDNELASGSNLVRMISDMVGPVHIASFWALYAQHGWAIPRMEVEELSLDDSDVGSIWMDQNGHRFVIGKLSGSSIYLLPEIAMDENGIYSASWNALLERPTSLSHVSGAVHTDSITGSYHRYDLLTQHVTERKYYVDGVEVSEDGEYHCNQLRIQEHILGYNVGKVEAWFPEPTYNGSLIDFDRSFEFNNGMSVTCNTTWCCRYPFLMTAYRSIQPQFPLQKEPYHSYSFIPKVKMYHDDQRVDMPFNSDDGTSPKISVRRSVEDLYDVNKQPERCVTVLKDDDGNYLVGMAGGCSLTKGFSTDIVRNSSIRMGQITALYGGGIGSSTENKFYPSVIGSSKIPVDTSVVVDVSGYYSWFDPGNNDCVVYYYCDDDNYIVYIHAFESMTKAKIMLPTFMEGMVVDGIVEITAGSSLLTDRVVGGKLYASFNTDENLANYIVVKLKSSWN